MTGIGSNNIENESVSQLQTEISMHSQPNQLKANPKQGRLTGFKVSEYSFKCSSKSGTQDNLNYSNRIKSKT